MLTLWFAAGANFAVAPHDGAHDGCLMCDGRLPAEPPFLEVLGLTIDVAAAIFNVSGLERIASPSIDSRVRDLGFSALYAVPSPAAAVFATTQIAQAASASISPNPFAQAKPLFEVARFTDHDGELSLAYSDRELAQLFVRLVRIRQPNDVIYCLSEL